MEYDNNNCLKVKMLVVQNAVDDQCRDENEIPSHCGIMREKRGRLAGRLTGTPVKTMGQED